MERSPLKNVENTRHEQAEKSYKKLYHDLVERHSVLQSQLDGYNSLFQKMGKIEQLKGQVLASLSEKQAKLEQQSQELERERRDWEQALSMAAHKQRELEKECANLHATCDCYRTDHTAMCGHLLAQLAIVKAQSRVQQETIQSLERKVTVKRVEIQKLKKTVSKYAHSLQRNHQEFQESLDFSEAERMALAEENAELTGKISILTAQLSEANQLYEEARILLKEREAELEAITHQKDMEQDTTIISVESGGCGQTCSGCGQLRCELDAALVKLNEQSCAKYGDLLRENFVLTQKLKAAEETVSKGMGEFEQLTTYIQDYKTKSKYKVEVLKENLSKAEEEISELDHIIDQVREVMHQEIGVVKHSPALLQLIRELDGDEAPKSY